MNTRQRALAKLQAIRSGQTDDAPLRRNPFEIFIGLVVLLLFPVPAMIVGIMSLTGVSRMDPVGGTILLVAAFIAAGGLAFWYFRPRVSTPFQAVKTFMKYAAGRNPGAAYHMLTDADKDDTPRLLGVDTFSFEEVEEFCSYWRAVRKRGGDEGRVMIDPMHRVTMIDDDLALVEFAFRDEIGQRGETHRKLVVRIEQEWRLFNGEWSGEEESDLRWTHDIVTEVVQSPHPAVVGL